MRTTARIVLTLALLGPLGPSNAATDPAVTRIVINHSKGTISIDGILELEPGAKIEFVVTETLSECFLYNGVPTKGITLAATQADTSPKEEVRWPTTHQKNVAGYRVEITKREGVDISKCQSLLPLTKEVPVVTLGWEVALAGAFTIDGLTAQEYHLVPQDGTDPQSYMVTRDRNAEDEYNNNLAVFIHLYNSANAWSKYTVEWAPLTFGVAFGDDTRYLIGSSAKFGDAFYLTAGYVIGKVGRLPTGIEEGTTTTDPNAIKAGNEKNDDSWFIGFSYKFLSTGAEDRLKGVFGGNQKAPPPPASPDGQSGAR